MAWLKIHDSYLVFPSGPAAAPRRRRMRGVVVVLLTCVLGPLLCLGVLKVAQRGLCALWRDEPVAYCTSASR